MVNYESLKNKVAFVTGGTSGIGKDIVKHLLLNNVNVVTCYFTNDIIAKETESELRNFGNLTVIKADVSDEQQIIELYHEIENRYGKLDYLINNAGISIDGFIEDYSIQDYKRVLEVNLIGKEICIKQGINLLKKSRSPRIINIASRLGSKAMLQSMAYCTSEAGVIMLTKVSALELSKYNIKVNTVSPSLTLTPLSQQFYTEEEIKETSEKNPSKRLGETTDIANTVMFLLSDEAEYINGENINVNGGILL